MHRCRDAYAGYFLGLFFEGRFGKEVGVGPGGVAHEVLGEEGGGGGACLPRIFSVLRLLRVVIRHFRVLVAVVSQTMAN